MHVILGILSLKYISDRYDVGIKNLEKDGFSLIESVSKDEFYFHYKAFVVPKESH
ncbi:MAG: hypothetical protein LBF97_05780 [Elusimicrobiota bacterium]|jgi:type I restriction enzyme M protein|nr:hypothetical protein [Elusimicrobiota bacterium]